MQVTDIRTVTQPIDGSKVPGFFSRYPAALSVDAANVQRTLLEVGEKASEPGSRERRRALVRHSNPHGDPFSICHCSADPEKLALLASIVEVFWIHDGILLPPIEWLDRHISNSLQDMAEELDHNAACKEHAALAEVLRTDIDPETFDAKNIRQSTLAPIVRRAIDIDVEQASKLVEVLKEYLDTFDSRADDFDQMDDYMPYRVINCGYWISSYFIRWGMGLVLSDSEYESIREYDFTMGNILGLTNDYFSWQVEKDQVTDRVRNGVSVLMKQHGVSSEAAKTMLIGLIVEEESKAARLKERHLMQPISKELALYYEAIELYVGGSCFWHATAPRYQ